MCSSQLTCGVMCMGLPVIYTENLIQRQRIRDKYGLHDATSCSEIGAGCCYPCSIFQSHTFLYVAAHHAARQQRFGANASHGPLISALRAMQRVTTLGSCSQDIAAIQPETRADVAVPSDPRTAEQSGANLHDSYTSPTKRPEAVEETTPIAERGASMTYSAAMAANGGVTASGIASSVGETPDQVVTLFGRGRHNSRPAPQNMPAVSASSAESRSTPASSSIPPPEVTDSPVHGRAVSPVPPYAAGTSHDEAESALADSTSFPVVPALPLNNAIRSPPKFDVPPALKPPDSADSEIISAWMQGPKLSHLSQTLQRPEQTSSVAQPSRQAAVPAASGMSVSDASMFSLALDAAASQASALPPAHGGVPTPSAASAASAARPTAPPAALAPSELPPLPLPLPMPTPGSSRDLNAAGATYDTITSSKLSSMIDHAMLNGSGSAGRGSAAAAGGGTALSSVDPAGPWDSYRHSTMAPIAEAEGEEGSWSNSNVTGCRVAQDQASAASLEAPGEDELARAGAGPSAASQRLAPVSSHNSERSLRMNGSGSSAVSSFRTAQGAPGASQRGSGSEPAAGVATGVICAGGAALTALARMGSDSGSNAVTAPGGSARAGSVYGRNPGTSTVPPPRRTAVPSAATAPAPVESLDAETSAMDSGPMRASARVDEDDEVDDGMGASADNFSLAAVTLPQVLLHGAGQPLQRQGPQARYGAPAARPAPVPTPAPFLGGCGDDDEVNLASIRPSFIDGPGMDHLKEALRVAGEKADAMPPPVSAAEVAAATQAMSSAPSTSQRMVVALPSNAAVLQQRGSSGSQRYGAAQAAPTSAGARAGAFGGVAASAAAPYASFCGDAPSQEDSGGGGSVEDDGSSVIDGPVSSGDEAGTAVVVHPAANVAARGRLSSTSGGPAPDLGNNAGAGEEGVDAIAVVAPSPRGTCAASVSDPAVEIAESAAFESARRSASGLSNGEPNVGYESVADSVCASQHRQKHWVNWMAQSSVATSMAANSVAVGESTRGAVRAGYGKPPSGLGARQQPEPGLSHISSINPVLEESTDGLYKRADAISGGYESGSDSESAEKLENLDEEAKKARKRHRALAPYLVSSPTHGIIGSSKYADRLRRQVVAAARDSSRKAVLIFGEPGLQKSNLATLIHFGGPCRITPMAYLDCARLDGLGAELFGRGERAGLVEVVGEGTLLLKNVHKMPPALVPKLVRLCAQQAYRRASTLTPPPDAGLTPLSSQDPPHDNLPPLRRAACRIIMTSNRQLPQLDDKVATVIKVPPLRLRPGDVKDLQRFYMTQMLRSQGSSATSSLRLSVTPAAVRQLESYTWPGNITELQAVVERAVLQGADEAAEKGGRLNEEVFWFAKQAKDRFRLNLLAAYPPLRRLLRSSLWPTDINFKFTAYVYPVIVALLLWGPPDRLHNPALAVFWDYWWPLVFVSFPLLGRVWCAVCPFMIFGELAQTWRTSPAGGGARLLKWPREAAERFGPPFLFSLFAAILVWEEVWDLPHSAALSGWLLLLITAGAVACSLVFERRLWCRYLCPIGGMNGLMAKLSMTEVRARQGVCSGECSTYHCYKGGCATPPDGLDSTGCPLYSHPAQLTDNRNCTNCMECLKACPNGSVEFRLRLPGTDLWSGHIASAGEVSLMFMLMGSVFLHHLDRLALQLGVDPAAAGLTGVTPQHIAASLVVLAAPGLAAWGADAAARRNPGGGIAAAAGPFLSNLVVQLTSRVTSGRAAAATAAAAAATAAAAAAAAAPAAGPSASSAAPLPQPAPFLALSYGYLPLLWSATLSHYLQPLLAEGGRLLPITAAMVGWEDAPLPVAVAHPAVIAFLQGSLLLFGAAASAALSRKLAAAPWAAFVPQLALIAAFTAELWALILE
ncbi:hypothetical protein PLESTF_000684000 [Pleodorina starrii]|nr:hypothetical protein PLESTF_000684000 [Pleodorina starrii]